MDGFDIIIFTTNYVAVQINIVWQSLIQFFTNYTMFSQSFSAITLFGRNIMVNLVIELF